MCLLRKCPRAEQDRYSQARSAAVAVGMFHETSPFLPPSVHEYYLATTIAH